MLHVDVPTRLDLASLLDARDPASVTLYLPTTPITADIEAGRIELKNLIAQAVGELRAASVAPAAVERIEELVADLIDDDPFWETQAHSLALFVTPDALRTFRLANRLTARVAVSDRFAVKPLLRAVTFDPSALVLALAQGSVSLWSITADLPPDEVRVEGMPRDAASAVGKASITGRSPSGRIQGSEGQKVRMARYARAVDRAIRPIVTGSDEPLILAATEPLASIFRSVTNAELLSEGIPGDPAGRPVGDLAVAAREILDRHHAALLAAQRERFAALAGQARASTDIAVVARAAAFGAVDTLLVDIDTVVPGEVDPVTGAIVEDADARPGHGVVDDIARLVLAAGGRVLAVRSADIPGQAPAAAILRYAM